jgi:hypothetical protein
MADRSPIVLAAVSFAAVVLSSVAVMRPAEAADMSATPQSAEPDLPTKKLTVPVTTAAAPTGDNGRLGPAAVRPGSNIWPRAWSGTEDKALANFASAATNAAICYIIEDQNPYFFATDRGFWCCMLLRRTGKSGRVFHVGGRNCRSHASYRVLHKRTRDIACDLIVEHMATVGGFIARAEVKHQDSQAAHKAALMKTLASLV